MDIQCLLLSTLTFVVLVICHSIPRAISSDHRVKLVERFLRLLRCEILNPHFGSAPSNWKNVHSHIAWTTELSSTLKMMWSIFKTSYGRIWFQFTWEGAFPTCAEGPNPCMECFSWPLRTRLCWHPSYRQVLWQLYGIQFRGGFCSFQSSDIGCYCTSGFHPMYFKEENVAIGLRGSPWSLRVVTLCCLLNKDNRDNWSFEMQRAYDM